MVNLSGSLNSPFDSSGKQKRKIKVLDVTHHIMNQSHMIDALKDDCEFYYLVNSWRSWHDKRFSSVRPVPKEIKWVGSYEPGKYDVAILHIDQQACNKRINKSRIFQELDKTISDIPKIVLNHGCPVYPEFFKQENPSKPLEQCQKECIASVRKLLHGMPMVVNSHTAASNKEWGWGNPIVHGMPHFTLQEEKEIKQEFKERSKKEKFLELKDVYLEYEEKLNKQGWWDLPKEPRIFTALSPGGLDSYYNRNMMGRVMGLLKDFYGHNINWAKINCKFDTFNTYREFLGGSLIYFDCSTRTPMNRARSEAMFSGSCVVQIEGAHDLDRWAKNMENIILVPNDAREIARTLADLLENKYDKCVKIGQAGKRMAMEEFNPERYRKDWLGVLKKTIEEFKEAKK